MKLIILLLSTLLYFSINAQSNKLTIGEKIILQSSILNEKREIWIHLPKNYDWAKMYENKKFNVVYLLDAEDNFTTVSGIYDQNSCFLNADFPEAIIVGITNIDRYKDFIPDHTETPTELCPSGKGENFTQFLEKELIPYIDSHYETSSYKTLIGHSIGGLLVVNTLAFHSRLFNSYIAIDPSLYHYTETQFTMLNKTLQMSNLKGIALYLGIANTIEGNYDISNVRNCQGDTNIHIQKILQFEEQLARNTSQLDFKSSYYSEYTHETVPIIAELEGFRFLFRHFIYKLTWNEIDNLNQRVIAKIENHYKQLSDYLDYEVTIPFGQANYLAYEALKTKNYKAAAYLFQLNFNNNPTWWNACDSYGDYFLETGNKKKAIEFYEKALILHNNKDSKQKLKQLKNSF